MKLMLGLMVVILFVAVIVPQNAVAQAGGAFYVEEVKEGRIYVFNDPKAYQLFKDSGELEVRITRIGAGPNGETMYFDSDNAIHLYNFKHGLPAEVIIKEEPKKPKMTFGWKDGKTSFESELATLTISNRIQVRYTHTQLGLPTATDPDLTPGDDYFGSFRIRRAKTKFEGWFYRKWLTYELQMNWPASPALEDANMNIDVTKGDQDFMVKGGQFKVPFGRQELTSSGSQEFVDRSIVSNRYARGRDQGVQLWGLALGSKLDWRVGVFNGNGINHSTDTDGNKQINARVTFQPWGDVKYSEGDFETTDKVLFAIAAQYENFNQQTLATTTTPLIRRELETYGFDAVLKYKGLFIFF
ncbi:OprO/OprP family phosphate-selective porin, partial [bacterium]|nr:OprO/OprP family phosphate-selective porin [bacterium]